jgi:hypothetical protein
VRHAKPFTISKQMVWEAYKRVKANQGDLSGISCLEPVG